jgi:hypothetical protein
MSECSPTTVFILPDPVMCGAQNVESVSSQAGPCTPGVIVDEDNCGDLVPTLTGIPEDPTAPDLEFAIQEPGGLNEAGFIFRSIATPPQPWVGSDDGRRFHRSWSHFFLGTHIGLGNSVATTFCERDKRIIHASVDLQPSPFEILIAARPVDGPYDSWSEIALDPESVGGPPLDPTATTHRIALAYLPNGTLLLAYVYVARTGGAAAIHSIAFLKSLDCGLTWQFVSSALESVSTTHQLRLTVSGSWVRVDTQTVSSNEFISAASPDGGISWTSEAISVSPATQPFQGGPVGIDESPYAVVGVGGGAYLLAYTIGAPANWRLAQAFGGEAWVDIQSDVTEVIREEPGNIVGMGGVVAHDRVYIVISYEDEIGSSTDDQLSMYYHPTEGIFAGGPDSASPTNPDPDQWQIVQGLSRYRGARFLPTRLDLVNTGQYMFLGGATYDTIDVSERIFKSVTQIGGYSAQSYGEVRPGGDLLSSSFATTREPLYDVLWQNINGRPAGGPSGISGDTTIDTEWGTTVGGAPVITYSPQQLSLVGGVGDTVTYDLTVPSTAANSWVIAGSTLGMIMQCNSGSSQVAPGHLVQIESQVDATDIIRFQVRIDPTGITIRDNLAVGDVGSIAIDTTGMVEIRVRFSIVGGIITGTLVAMRLDSYFTVVATDFVLSQAPVAPLDRIEWGALGVAVAGDTEWREVWISKNVTRDKAVGFNPTCLLGIPTAFDRTLLTNCLFISWGGGAGAPGDRFTMDPCFTHPASAVFTEACHIDWRTIDTASPGELILVADPNNAQKRFVHDSVVLCGTEDRFHFIDYDDDPAFPSPSATTTLDSLLFGNLTAAPAAGQGNVVTFTVAPNTRRPIDGELAGMRLRFTAGTITGNTFCIATHCGDQLTLDTDVDVAALITPGTGSPFDVFSPFVFGDHAATRIGRYMRIRHQDLGTCTGDHRIGHILAGCKITLPFQLDWTHSDLDTPDVTVFDGPGVRWGYQRAAPLKLWTGRITNDPGRWRESFRMLMESLTRYQVRALALIVDESNPRSLIRGTFQPAELENSFWFDKDDGNGPYRFPGGDMRISISEVP